MAITDIESLNNIINSLLMKIPLSISKFSKKMSSDEFNNIMLNVQKTLDSLYEKARLIQDLRQYSEKVIKKEYLAKRAELDKIYKMIKESASDYENSENIAHEAFFEVLCPTTRIFDRNGEQIPVAETVGMTSLLQANTMAASPDKCTVSATSNIEAYNRKVDSPNNYRAYYVTNEPFEDGIKETVNVSFNTPCNVNFVNIEPFFCNVLKLSLIKTDNTLIDIDINDYRVESELIKGIKIEIVSNSYKPVENAYHVHDDAYDDLMTTCLVPTSKNDTIAEKLIPSTKEVLV